MDGLPAACRRHSMTRRECVPELKRIALTHIVASPSSLDAARWPEDAIALRIAPDELLVTTEVRREIVKDPYGIIEPDAGFAACWIPADEALELLKRSCKWELPRERPAFAQGAVAGLPVKLWLETERVLFITPAPFATDLEERLS